MSGEALGWRVTVEVGPAGFVLDVDTPTPTPLAGAGKPDGRPVVEGAPGGVIEHGYGFNTPRWTPLTPDGDTDP